MIYRTFPKATIRHANGDQFLSVAVHVDDPAKAEVTIVNPTGAVVTRTYATPDAWAMYNASLDGGWREANAGDLARRMEFIRRGMTTPAGAY